MNEVNVNSLKAPPAPPSGFNLADVYFTLFRHWKMILLFALLGVVAAGVVYFKRPPVYTSEAKLLIRFVVDKRTINPAGPDSQVTTPDNRGDNIMNSEVEILDSLDLALETADQVGPEKIVGKGQVATNRFAAAAVIRKGTVIDVPKRSNIIRVGYSHRDPEVVQSVLSRLVEAYLSKHVEIHKNRGALDELMRRQRDQLKLALTETENKIRDIRTNYGIVSIDESKRSYVQQIEKISTELVTAETELAESKLLQGHQPQPLSVTNAPATNQTAIPPEKLEEYRLARTELESLSKMEKELRVQYTDEHPARWRFTNQLATAEKQVRQFETNYPGIARMLAAAPSAPTPGRPAVISEPNQVELLQAKVAILKSQLARLQSLANALMDAEIRLTELERTKQLQETNYRYYQVNLDQVTVDEALGPGKVMGIDMVQSPSAPAQDSKSAMKPLAMALFGPFGFGLALAFLIDVVLDQSIRRPSELRRSTSIPLMASIPEQPGLGRDHRKGWLSFGARKQLPAPLPDPSKGDESAEVFEAPLVLKNGDPLRPVFESLRDRLVTFFEVQGLTHKPKLVAVTGCEGATGATTISVGLAASLSETGDGKVLLVDMNSEGGAAQHFFHGKPALGLLEALAEGKAAEAQVQDQLYVVTEHQLNGGLSRMLPKRFAQLVPKLKLSEYDYVIFDLPEMGHSSIAPRVARFMDYVLLVAEAGRTNREIMRESAKILTDTGANVGSVLNRTRNYVPRRLSQELT